MTTNATDGLERAIKGLEAGIRKAIERIERHASGDCSKLRQRAKRLKQNIRHCFVHLRQNQRSLQIGLQCFERLMEQLDLKVAFATLLRLHDGYILTVSGECRHDGDRETAVSSAFPSKLHGNESVYSKHNVYNGVSWDEWNDEKCGLRKRLCDTLRLNYDAFVEPGKPAAIFEAMVSETEHTLIEMQGDFKRLKLKMERVFSARLVWQDRMEKLTADRIHLERVGSQFQVSTALGISSVEDWEAVMKPKRKKRIIVESDEEDSEHLDVTKVETTQAHGLHVKVAAVKKTISAPTNVSVNQIKETMGVDVQQLENARMELEGEEEQARLEAEEIDEAEPEIPLDEAKLRVRRARKAYERALLLNDDTNLWNAREMLREELMRTGDLMVGEDDEALKCFESAAALVRAQQKLNTKLKNDAYFGLNLLMLLCRAQINISIACIQIGLRRPARRKQCLERACQEAENATRHSMELRHNGTEAADKLRAFQLHALAKRNNGVALWHSYQRKEAQKAFELAAVSPQLETDGPDDYAILFECHVERYNAWTTFADLAIGTLERAEMKSIRENAEFYADIYQMVKKAMTGAMEVSTYIETFLCTEGRMTKSVTTAIDLQTSLQEIETWWEERSVQANSRIKTAPHTHTLRSDLTLLPSKAPPRRFVIGGRSHQADEAPPQQKNRRQPSSHRHTPPATTTPVRRYRKWREDMIMDESSGKWVPKLEYPAAAPPMPPEFAVLLAARRSHQQTV